MATRIPKQERSRASVERMVEAAEKLMSERGVDDFTLAELSEVGRVSIGAIYYRFSSKDDLVRLIHARLIGRLDAEVSKAMAAAVDRAQDLPGLVMELINGLADTLRTFAPLLRPLMLRSVTDPQVRSQGKDSYARMSEDFRNALLTRRAEIRHPQPEEAASASYSIAYAALARSLGFNLSPGQVGDFMDWHTLKQNLSVMCAAFLLTGGGPVG